MPCRFSGSPDRISLSNHARQRMVERGISPDDVSTILHRGTVYELSGGRYLVTILPSPFLVLDSTGKSMELQNCSVLIAEDGGVVTVYRNDERCPLFRFSACTD
ncbi:hypothetical protein B4O97_16305 [Marispirochaeta aestuarii]|uniref:DUF4258 domain-containing protein n=1 Tax=Marispirochaeta aestuarii TaxID=1963862 RepID=A0A1Y1RUC4_9SPIO|nr:hypothetical protein B4O97_16305 [Marispirochaeta aestuarii]